MTMRCDRLFSFEQPFSLKIVADVINSFNAKKVVVIEPHSSTCLDLIKNSEAIYTSKRLLEYPTAVCFPDKGAFARYAKNMIMRPYIVCSKVRDIETGKIVSFSIDKVVEYKEGNEISVVDDLCDGGGTFVGIAVKLRELNPSKLNLVVTHAVQKDGIERVSGFYDQVIITNSYKDWKGLPSNVIIENLSY